MWTERTPVKRRVACVVFALALTCTGCRTAPIVDDVEIRLSAARGAAAAEVEEAIWRAGRKVGWEIQPTGPAELRGTWRFKQHLAVVSITYAGDVLRIRYVESRNLRYDGERIHHNYNVMVQRLADQIALEPIRSGVGAHGDPDGAADAR